MATPNHNIAHYLYTAVFVLFKSLVRASVWIVIALVGFLFLMNQIPPWDILIGLPLLLIGGGLAVNKLTTAALAIFYPSFNRGICTLCEN